MSPSIGRKWSRCSPQSRLVPSPRPPASVVALCQPKNWQYAASNLDTNLGDSPKTI